MQCRDASIVANHSRGIRTPPLPRTPRNNHLTDTIGAGILLLLDPELVPMLMGNDSDMRLTTGDPSEGKSLLSSTGKHITIVLLVSYSGTCTGTPVRLLASGDSNN